MMGKAMVMGGVKLLFQELHPIAFLGVVFSANPCAGGHQLEGKHGQSRCETNAR